MQMLRKRQGTVLCLLAENEETENRPLSLPEIRPLLENVFSGEQPFPENHGMTPGNRKMPANFRNEGIED